MTEDRWAGPSITQFYNKCHDEGGRFCGGKSGDKKEPIFGRAWYDDPPDKLGWSNDYPDIDTSGQEDRDDQFFKAYDQTKANRARRKEDHTDYLYSSVDDYAADGYEYYNNYLRGKPIETDNPNADALIKASNIFTKMSIRDIDTLFEEDAVSTGGSSVFRGAKRVPGISYAPGSIIQDAGYLSTSSHPGFPKRQAYLAGQGEGVFMKIKTKSDTKALVGSGAESEFVLNRDTPLKVITVASDLATRNLIVEAEVL